MNATAVVAGVICEMGAAESSSTPGADIVTVSERSTAANAPDPDLLALRRLPHASPLLKQPSLRGLLLSAGSRPVTGLPEVHPRNVSALCREYASLSRQAALPICEEQRAIAKKMTAVEALCARVLYLMALRSSELSASAASLRELTAVGDSIREGQIVVQQLFARAQQLERLLPTTAGGGALG